MNSVKWIVLCVAIAALAIVAVYYARRSPEQPAPSVDDGPLPSLLTPDLRAEQQRQENLIDPSHTGWMNEALADKLQSQLQSWLTASLVPGKSGSNSKLAIAEDFTCYSLRPQMWSREYERENVLIRVWQPAAVPDEGDSQQATVGTPKAALDTLSSVFSNGKAERAKAKLFDIEVSDDHAVARFRCEFFGRGQRGLIQQTAQWETHWRRVEQQWVLSKLQPAFVEEVQSNTFEPWFADCTTHVLGGQPAFGEQLAFGLHHWLGRVERFHGMQYYQQFGLAVGDVNGDDLDDLYVCQAGGLPNRLFLQQADGTAKDVSEAYGVDWLDNTASALLVDLDNDGDQDLALATFEGVLLLSNDNGRQFHRALLLPVPERDVQGLSAVDYDGDGDLDLYLTIDYSDALAVAQRGERLPRFRFDDANDGGRNLLMRNDIRPGMRSEEWRFADVTTQVGLDVRNRRHSLAAAWEDYDNDGDQDLYVANDYGQNCLYRNDGGSFTEVACEAGVVDQGAGMSVSWGDVNRDGRMDLYVGNMYSFAGNRLSRQSRFLSESSQHRRNVTQRFAKGNTLFVNGEEGFADVGAAGRVEMGRWAWASPLADLDSDGWHDIVVANGYLTTPDTGDL